MAKKSLMCDICGEDLTYSIEDGFYMVEPCANCISNAEDEAIKELLLLLQREKTEEPEGKEA